MLPAAWASRSYLYVSGLTSDSFPSAYTSPSTNNLGREHSKSHVGLVQVLLILSVMVSPSAMQALEDWQKSLNWNWLAPIDPIVNLCRLPSYIRLWALQLWGCLERACKPMAVFGAGAHRGVRRRVPLRQAPPCERIVSPRCGGRRRSPAGGNYSSDR